jgi:hypothetical protein
MSTIISRPSERVDEICQLLATDRKYFSQPGNFIVTLL